MIPSEEAFVGEGPMNFRDLSLNCMARDKALYEGHAVAAVAATTQAIADEALALIDVKYEVLPHRHRRGSGDGAGCADPARRHVHRRRRRRSPTKPSNIAKVVTFKKGDVEAGFKEAEVIVEGRYTTQPVHQAYIEPHACLATYAPDGQVTIHSSSQGHFMVRAYTAKLLGIDMSNIRVNPAEIGGGFGGKTLVYLEPVAVALSKKSGRSVKMQMTREDVFRASGPTSGAADGGQDRRQEGRHHRRRQAGAEIPGGRVSPARRSGRAACAGSPCMTCRTSMSSATTWSATARRSRPIAPPARRSPPSPSKAPDGRTGASSSAWTR